MTLEGPVERIAAGFAAGCGLMISALFLLGLTGLFYRSIFVGMLVLPPAIFWKETRDIFFDVRALNLRWRDSKDLTHPFEILRGTVRPAPSWCPTAGVS